MKILKGDILTVKKGIICHQTNCQGVMGAGLALQIRNKWPKVYRKYKTFCQHTPNLLGRAQYVIAGPQLGVVNLFGQDFYGGDLRCTNYEAVARGFEELQSIIASDYKHLYIPKLMGCALAGGAWDIYLAIAKYYFPNINVVAYDPNNPALKEI